MSLKNVLTDDEVAALKQSIGESLNISFGAVTEAKAEKFWRTINGQKMQFLGTPDDGKPDQIVRGGNANLKAAMGATTSVLKSIVDKVKKAKSLLGKAKDGVKDSAAGVKRAARDAMDAIAAITGDTF